MLTICLASVTGAMNFSMLSVALPSIVDDLHVSVATGAWLFIIPSLASSSLQSIGGRLGDLFGYRRMFIIGALGFVVASVLASAAPTFWALVAGRVLIIMGSSAMQPNSGALVRVHMPATQRASAFGTMVASMSLAFAAGPLIGGALVATVGWRALFIVAVPFTLLAVLLSLRWVPADPPHTGERRSLDVVGGDVVVNERDRGRLPLNLGGNGTLSPPLLPSVTSAPGAAVRLRPVGTAPGGAGGAGAAVPDAHLPGGSLQRVVHERHLFPDRAGTGSLHAGLPGPFGDPGRRGAGDRLDIDRAWLAARRAAGGPARAAAPALFGRCVAVLGTIPLLTMGHAAPARSCWASGCWSCRWAVDCRRRRCNRRRSSRPRGGTRDGERCLHDLGQPGRYHRHHAYIGRAGGEPRPARLSRHFRPLRRHRTARHTHRDSPRAVARERGRAASYERGNLTTAAEHRLARNVRAEIVRGPEDADDGSREYTARDLEGRLWSFGPVPPAAGCSGSVVREDARALRRCE